jgi:hypothetical protein
MKTTKTNKRAARLRSITTDEMHEAIEELVGAMSTADLLSIPGIYEILADEMNNEAIDLILEAEGLGEDDEDECTHDSVAHNDDDELECSECGEVMDEDEDADQETK